MIRNDNEVEQGRAYRAITRYPSKSNSGDYILRRKGNAKIIFVRKTEVQNSGMREPEVGEEVE